MPLRGAAVKVKGGVLRGLRGTLRRIALDAAARGRCKSQGRVARACKASSRARRTSLEQRAHRDHACQRARRRCMMHLRAAIVELGAGDAPSTRFGRNRVDSGSDHSDNGPITAVQPACCHPLAPAIVLPRRVGDTSYFDVKVMARTDFTQFLIAV